MTFTYPKLNFFPCTVRVSYLPLQINDKTIKPSTIIEIEFPKPVDVTYPWPNTNNKSYTNAEIRRIVGTFLEMNNMFSFDDDMIYVDKYDQVPMPMIIRIGHPTENFANGHSEYYWYHTAMTIVELLTNTKTGIFGVAPGEVDGQYKEVVGFRFQPCVVKDLEKKSLEHLDD